jgi:hypothetical protein
MRTVKEIKKLEKQRIEEFQKLKNSESFKVVKREESKCKKEIAFYRDCVLYIQSNPTKEFLVKQKESVLQKIDNIEQAMIKREFTLTKDKTAFKKSLGIDKLNTQLKYLNFILDL